MNPAKDLTGLVISNYVYDYFDSQSFYSLNNIIGSFIGAILGSHAYMFFVEYQWYYGRNDYFYNKYPKTANHNGRSMERGSHVLSPGVPRYETAFGPEELTNYRLAHLYEPQQRFTN